MDLSFLPAVNASLNSVAIVLLLVGLYLIKVRRWQAHRNVMLSACAVSTLFLALYLLHKWWKATTLGPEAGLHTTFNYDGWLKVGYLLILFTHLVLAMLVPVFAVMLVYSGWRRSDSFHKRWGKIAWPIWMYVSVTGVVIYLLLYHLNAPPPVA